MTEKEKEKEVRTTIRLSKKMHTDFKKFCVENDISMTEFLTGCIEKVLKEQTDKSSKK